MFFSKSFGYAVRGVLYVAIMQDEKHFVQVEEIASKLNAPKHFMGKILKRLVKEKVLKSVKGPSGGFTVNESTLNLSLLHILTITDGADVFDTCVLSAKECNAKNPCPMHYHVVEAKNKLQKTLFDTTIRELLNGEKSEFLKSLSTGIVQQTVSQHSPEKIY